jgi:hypothetical protein
MYKFHLLLLQVSFTSFTSWPSNLIVGSVCQVGAGDNVVEGVDVVVVCKPPGGIARVVDGPVERHQEL